MKITCTEEPENDFLEIGEFDQDDQTLKFGIQMGMTNSFVCISRSGVEALIKHLKKEIKTQPTARS